MSLGSPRHSAAPSVGSRAVRPATPPSRSESAGRPRQRRRKQPSSPLSAEIVERGYVDGIEAFADPEQEDADDDEGDQDREGYADLDDERHAFGAGRRQHQPVLERHESHYLTDGVAAGHHDQKSEQPNRPSEGGVLPRPRGGP